MERHGEGLQRPCGDQPEMSVRRGKPQASDGPRLQGWVSCSLFNLPGVLGLRSREGRESQAIWIGAGSKALPHALLLTSWPSKAASALAHFSAYGRYKTYENALNNSFFLIMI